MTELARKNLGRALIATPFIGMAVFSLLTLGLVGTLGVFGLCAAIVLCISVGNKLAA